MPGESAAGFDGGRGLFVEPYAPHEVIGVMHLAGREQQTHLFRLNRLDGGTVETSLRYGESRGLCGRALAEHAACVLARARSEPFLPLRRARTALMTRPA